MIRIDHAFAQEYVQTHMLRVLTVWACLHPCLSYRQGMHELLAPIIKVLDQDVGVQQRLEATACNDDSDDARCLAALLTPTSVPRFLVFGLPHVM